MSLIKLGFLRLNAFYCCLCVVFSRSGKPLGLIALPEVVNLGFAGKQLNKLFILNDASIHMIELQVRESISLLSFDFFGKLFISDACLVTICMGWFYISVVFREIVKIMKSLNGYVDK